MNRNVASLASIAGCACFFGFFGSVRGILTAFHSIGAESAIFADQASHMSQALVPGMFGLFVALLAFWFHRYLSNRSEMFDLEMEGATLDLVNRLTVHLGRLRTTNPAAWAALTGKPTCPGSMSHGPASVEPPNLDLTISRMFRNGVLQLIWPQIESKFEAESILTAGSCICVAYGFIGFVAYWNQQRTSAGLIIFIFFVAAALAMKKRALEVVLSVCSLFSIAVAACLLSDGISVTAASLAAAPLLLMGSLKAAGSSRLLGKIASTPLLRLESLLVAALLISASISVLFGTIFGLYKAQGEDHSMYPTVLAGDWLVGLHSSVTGPIRRSELVQIDWGELGTVRVVALPGDRVQIRRGKLVLNGAAVQEPYCQPFSDPIGDFPLSSEAYLDPYVRQSHDSAFGSYWGKKTPTRFLQADTSCPTIIDNN